MSILLNDFAHRRHPKSFSPVCTLMWFWRTLDVDVHSRLQKVTQNTKWFCTLKAVVGILIIRVYSLHVVLKDTFLWKPCFTIWTVVWFLCSVQSLMVLKIVFSWKQFITKWTAERFLSRVQSNVGLKVRFLCKRFFTQWTAERFLSSVQSHMVLKCAFSIKKFVTNWTAVRFLSFVHPCMHL